MLRSISGALLSPGPTIGLASSAQSSEECRIDLEERRRPFYEPCPTWLLVGRGGCYFVARTSRYRKIYLRSKYWPSYIQTLTVTMAGWLVLTITSLLLAFDVSHATVIRCKYGHYFILLRKKKTKVEY